MKKLSEIGTHIKPDPNSLTQFEEHWIMTRDERRELVRAVWEAAVELMLVADANNQLYVSLEGDDVEQFIREQGL